MWSREILITISFVAPIFGAAIPSPSHTSSSTTSSATPSPLNYAIVPDSYIVQVADGSNSFSNLRSSTSLPFTVRHEFTDSSVFLGVSIKVNPGHTIDAVKAQLEAVPDVVRVWPNYKIMHPFPAVGFSNISSFHSKPPKNPLTPPKISGNLDVLSALKMSDIDKLHARGIKGKGIKIGILDTGVDYRHPSLGGGFGPKFKIAGGHAFVDDTWEDGDPVESADPLSTCLSGGHGTHTAGIIGMDDPDSSGFGIRGVAPEASIYSYRVFGCAGSTTTEILILALQMAARDGMDLTSNSWGAGIPYEEDNPYAIITANLAKRGIATIAATGNDGAAGLYFPSAPAIGGDVIAVGSIANTKFPITYKATDSRGQDVAYSSVWPLDIPGGMNTYLMGSGKAEGCTGDAWYEAANLITDKANTLIILPGDLCTQLPSIDDFTHRLLVKLDSSDPFATDFNVRPGFDDDPMTLISVNAKDGKALMDSYKKAGGYGNHKIMFSSKLASSVDQLTGGFMSNYSSFGPSWDTLALKPQLSAPGGNILSTWPLSANGNGGYAIISGTSMATPFVAGAYALVKSQLPKLSVEEIKNLLQTTSNPVSWLPDKSILSSAVHQGSGLVNPYKAINSQTSISPAQFALGDSDAFTNVAKKITITNNGILPRIYTVAHQGAGFAEHFPYPEIIHLPYEYANYGQPQYANYGSVKLSKAYIVLLGKSSTTIDVVFSPPKSFVESRDPVFSGYITVSSLDGEKYVVPYAGIPYSRKNAQYFDLANDANPPPNFQISKDVTVGNYTVPQQNLGLDTYNLTGPVWWQTEYVTFPYDIVQYTSKLRIDIVPADTAIKPTHYGYNPNPQEPYHIQTSKSVLSSKFLSYPTYGYAEKHDYFIPTKGVLGWLGTVTASDDVTETTLLAGDYRMLLSVLRSGALDATKLESYETWLSPIIRLQF